MALLDSVVIQITDLTHGGDEERVLVQQHEVRDAEGVVTTPHKCVNVPYTSLPSEVKTAYDTLKAHLQTKLDT